MTHPLRHLFVVVPTFKEPHLVERFLEDWRLFSGIEATLLICNGFPNDETTCIIKQIGNYPHTLEELHGSANLFWSGLVELGLHRVQEIATADDYVLLMNIDISFDSAAVLALLDQLKKHPRAQIAPLVSDSSGYLLTAGVVVRSWSLSLNTHLFSGKRASEVMADKLVPVTYLPTRMVVFPADALTAAGMPASQRLPHYCGDFEYTNRLRRCGFPPFVYTRALVHNDETNTGLKTGGRKSTLTQRLRNAFNVKCPYNIKSRFWFVWLAYPKAALFLGYISHFLKILIEVCFGCVTVRQLETSRKFSNK